MSKILVIDDNSDERKVLKEFLERSGYQVDEAPEGGVGLNLYRAYRHDLVITGIVMPGTEGIETILELVHDFPDVKIIAVSGGGYLGAANNYLKMASILGAKRVFEKPIDLDAVLGAVSEMLETAFSDSARALSKENLA